MDPPVPGQRDCPAGNHAGPAVAVVLTVGGASSAPVTVSSKRKPGTM